MDFSTSGKCIEGPRAYLTIAAGEVAIKLEIPASVIENVTRLLKSQTWAVAAGRLDEGGGVNAVAFAADPAQAAVPARAVETHPAQIARCPHGTKACVRAASNAHGAARLAFEEGGRRLESLGLEGELEGKLGTLAQRPFKHEHANVNAMTRAMTKAAEALVHGTWFMAARQHQCKGPQPIFSA